MWYSNNAAQPRHCSTMQILVYNLDTAVQRRDSAAETNVISALPIASLSSLILTLLSSIASRSESPNDVTAFR
jgi:hypothetical protein